MIKTKYLVIFLALLVLGMSVAVAADVDDSTSTTKKVTKDTTKIVKNTAVTKKATKTTDKKTTTKAKENTKTKNTTEKTITKNTQTKSVKRGETYNISNSNFDTYFKETGFGTNVGVGDTFNFIGDINKNKSIIVDKPVTIIGNNKTIELNTINGYNLPTSNPTSFNFVAGAANTNVSYIHFHNTQVFVNDTSNIVFDHINVTNVDQGVGKGVGVFSIRDGSTNITVKNSNFLTNNNTGCSNLVLAYANNCTIENNTIIGMKKVGNLLYTTTYNTAGVNYMDTSVNQYNYFHNNRIYGYNITGGVCIGVVVSGHNNTYDGNNVSVSSAFSGQWISPTATYVGNFSDAYEGNLYINNDINGSFTGTKNSTITGNIFHGSVSLPERCIFKNNNAENSTVTITGKNCNLCNDTVNTIVLNKAATNTSICYDMSGVTIVNTYELDINWYFHPSSLTLTKKLSRSVKNDGEQNVINITEDNFTTYFKNNQFNLMSLGITADTVFNLCYIPSTQKRLTFAMISQNPIEITFVGKNLTLENVYFQVQGSNAIFKDMNFNYTGNGLNNHITFMWMNPVAANPNYPIIFDNVTVNFDGEYVLNDDGPAISPVISSTSTKSMVIINNSEINAEVPAPPEGYNLISGPGISLINNNITIKEKYAVDDSSSLSAMGLRTQSGYPMLIDNNHITVLGKSDLVGITFEESVTNSNITNNIITVTSTEATATGIKLNGNDNIVTGNAIIANDVMGDDAVVDNGENNVVQDNGPMATELTVISPSVVNVNEISPMTVILKDAKGNLLANQDINVTVGDESEIIATDSSGIAVYEFLPINSGSVDVVFNYIGGGLFLSSNKTVPVTVNEDKDAIIEELNKTINEQKETIASQEEDIADLNNIIEEQDDEIESLTNTTQALNNTVAQLEQDIKDVQEQLANNNNTNNGNGTSNNTSTPTKTSVTLKVNPTTIYTGSKTKITVTLKDANGKAVASQKITVKVGSKTYTVKTNKKGVATKTVKVTKTGKNKVTATFKATKKYAKATKSSTLTVKAKEKTKITVSKLSYKNKKITIKATIKAGKKALTQNTKLTIKVDGKTLTSKKISKKGKISLTLKKALKNGSHKVQIISKATSMYKQAKVSKTLKV